MNAGRERPQEGDTGGSDQPGIRFMQYMTGTIENDNTYASLLTCEKNIWLLWDSPPLKILGRKYFSFSGNKLSSNCRNCCNGDI